MIQNRKYLLTETFNYNRYEKRFKVGDLVKLTFTDLDGDNGESMWVRITKAEGYVEPAYRTKGKSTYLVRSEAFETRFEGELANIPEDAIYTNPVIFKLSHICQG